MILNKIIALTGVKKERLINFSNTASFRYKSYYIAKKNGGQRKIDHPSRELKSLQKLIIRELLEKLPVHQAATAYRPGLGIKHNAQEHMGKKFLLRLDFKDFFPSITQDLVFTYIKDKFPNQLQEEYLFFSKIVCRHGKLTIGAPTSPLISNLIFYDFDKTLSVQTRMFGITYTRYADDLYFSTNEQNILANVRSSVITTLKHHNLPITLNDDKSVFTSKKRLRAVTGIILTSDNKLSVGRTRKRMIKTLVFKFKNGHLSKVEQLSLKGQISYIASVEPEFLRSLNKKFGPTTLYQIQRIENN